MAPAEAKLRKEIWGPPLGTYAEAEEGRISWLLGSSSLQSPGPLIGQIAPKPA